MQSVEEEVLNYNIRKKRMIKKLKKIQRDHQHEILKKREIREEIVGKEKMNYKEKERKKMQKKKKENNRI